MNAKKMKRKDTQTWTWIIIVIVVVLFIILFIITLGKANIGNNSIWPKEFRDSKEAARKRYNELTAKISQQENLQRKLLKKFNRSYFIIRLVFIALWAVFLGCIYTFGLAHNLEDALNYSEALILFILALNFLTFGTISNMNNFVDLVKMRLKNYIWRKNPELEHALEKNKNELVIVKNNIYE